MKMKEKNNKRYRNRKLQNYIVYKNSKTNISILSATRDLLRREPIYRPQRYRYLNNTRFLFAQVYDVNHRDRYVTFHGRPDSGTDVM